MTDQGWIILAGIGGTLLLAIILFNTLIGRKNRVNLAFSSIGVMLKKRFDLIPNLLASVKQYVEHERSLLERLTRLRAEAMAAGGNQGKRMEAENQISGALRSLFAVAENYPALRANENYLQLQAALNEVEEQLSASRRAYNAAVTDYNNGVEMFPLNLTAKLMGYTSRAWLEIPEQERQPVRIDELSR